MNYNEDLWKKIIDLAKNRIKKEIESLARNEKLLEWYKNKEINLNQIEIKETTYAKLGEKSNQEDWKAFLEKLDSIRWDEDQKTPI